MKLHEVLSESLKEKFAAAKIDGTRDMAARPGYFFIKKVYFKPIKMYGEIPMAKVNWKSNIDAPFIEDIDFEIALSSLYSAHPDETAGFQYSDLEGKTIKIFNPSFVTKMIGGNERRVLNCVWSLENAIPVFINANNSSIYAFGASTSTLIEACQKFKVSAPYDVDEAEELEGLASSFGDSYIEFHNDYPDMNDDGQDNYGDFDDDPIGDEPDNS